MSAQIDEPSAKRRKVRKGTQSCWECKKRKVRCIWESEGTSLCVNCVRRKTNCVSQEFDDVEDRSRDKSSDRMEERLSRVENLLEKLVENAGASHLHNSIALPRSRLEDRCLDTSLIPFLPDMPTLTSTPNPSSPPLLSRYTGLSGDLLRAWPIQNDLNLICELPVGLSTHLHLKLWASSSDLFTQERITPEAMLQLPPPGSHPVLFARKLLILGSLLQGAISASQVPVTQRAHFKTTMSSVVDTASKLVISNDDLTASVEGVESIMILAMIQNYAGELHRAWMTTRRASAVAQMIGLHRSGSKLKTLDPETRAALSPEQLCYRIVEMDRYLSITLGLPQSSLESSILAAETLVTCHPFDRLARLQVIVAGRIISNPHTHKMPTDMAESDRLLQESAAQMPSQWWLVPNYETGYGNPLEPAYEVARIMYQFSHFHLVIRLHLPYMLRPSIDGDSKATAVHASREILARYIAFRSWNPGHYYCRGVDYLSFIALTVLCLAHIDERNPYTEGRGSGIMFSHSRPSDRAVMERTVGILKAMEEDAIAEKLSKIMQHLLDVEAASANGAGYSASATESGEEGTTECDGGFGDIEKDKLQLHIPYFGMISLQRRVVGTTTGRTTRGKGDRAVEDFAVAQDHRVFPEWDDQWLSSADLGELDDWTLQSINEGLFSSLLSGMGDQDANPNTQ